MRRQISTDDRRRLTGTQHEEPPIEVAYEEYPPEERPSRPPPRKPASRFRGARYEEHWDHGSYQVKVERSEHDNTPEGFFHGRASFAVALIWYYLGGVIALGALTMFLGSPDFLVFISGGWVFVGLFFVAWNSRNIQSSGMKYAVYGVIALAVLLALRGIVS